MNLGKHDQRDDMKVWLSKEDVTELLEATEGTQESVVIGLGVRCGLRSHEILDVAPEHVHDTDAGMMLRVWHGKGDKYRETPIPADLATTIRTVGDIRGDTSSSVVDVTTTRSLRRMLSRVVDRINSDDDGWNHLTMHDLRRTWATQLRGADADTMVVCDWGGWNDLDTFLDHYKGTSTPEAQKREREKVEWL
jgi:integrase